MAKVQKANRILTIKDELVPYYVDQGYNVISAGGRVLQEAVPTDLPTLQKAYMDNKARIAQLEREIAELRKQPEAMPNEETPARSRRKRNTDD